jgi:hypothetical protein
VSGVRKKNTEDRGIRDLGIEEFRNSGIKRF